MFVPEFPERCRVKCNMLAATARCQGCGQQHDTSVPFDMASHVRDCSTQTDVVVYHDILPAGVDLAREGGGPRNAPQFRGNPVARSIWMVAAGCHPASMGIFHSSQSYRTALRLTAIIYAGHAEQSVAAPALKSRIYHRIPCQPPNREI